MSNPDFNDADALAVGAFGEPGRRVFMLQARQGMQVLTLKIEKGQAAQLASHLEAALADRAETAPDADISSALMTAETEPAWVVGAMRLGYDPAADRVDLVLDEFRTAAEEEAGPIEAEPASVRITINGAQAVALIAAIEQLVAAGRPPCPDCGYPLDPAGHVCPRRNGHRPPTL